MHTYFCVHERARKPILHVRKSVLRKYYICGALLLLNLRKGSRSPGSWSPGPNSKSSPTFFSHLFHSTEALGKRLATSFDSDVYNFSSPASVIVRTKYE